MMTFDFSMIAWILLFIFIAAIVYLWSKKMTNNPVNHPILVHPLQSSDNPGNHQNPHFPLMSTFPVYESKIHPGQPSNVDRSRITGDRLGPLDPANPIPPTVIPSHVTNPNLPANPPIQEQQSIKPEATNLLAPRIPIDYLPLPMNPLEPLYQTPNFDSEALPVAAFFKTNPLDMEGIMAVSKQKNVMGEAAKAPAEPKWRRSVAAGALTTNMYRPDYWNYQDELVMNGGDFGGITPSEPGSGIFGAYPSARLNDNSSGYYPGVNPNTNSVGLPHIEHRKDDLRMGLGIPSRQAEMINQRLPE